MLYLQITTTTPVLMLALELGEDHWKIGFSSAFGQEPLVRDIGSRDKLVLLSHIAWAKKKLGLTKEARVVSCYEAGREGFWLHRFLVANGVENLIVDSSSIEVPQIGTLDSDPKRTVDKHFHVGSKAPWVELSDSLPKEEGGVPFGKRD